MDYENGRAPADPLREWIEGAKENDRGAWESLYRRYRGLLLVAIRAQGVPVRMRGRFDTEDVLQSCFFSVWQHLGEHEFRDEPSFRAWLKTIAMNKLADRKRFNQRDRRDTGTESDVPEERMGREETPSMNLERLEVQERTLEGLTHLSEEDQELVCWHALEKFSLAEIARFRGCSESTARRHYQDAIRRLQATLREIS